MRLGSDSVIIIDNIADINPTRKKKFKPDSSVQPTLFPQPYNMYDMYDLYEDNNDVDDESDSNNDN